MTRTLLLCFVHGFKGTDNTFHDFPDDLRRNVAKQLTDHRVEAVVYPKYETKGELSQASEALLEWVKEQVMTIRKARSETPWPPDDRDVGVIFVSHSMGGFVAADALFLALRERASNPSPSQHMFPLIQGILSFDTPYNGLARSMFVYGAFSNYQKVSTVFNAMTALSAAAPAGLARLGSRTATSSAAAASTTPRSPQWTAWQLLAVRTGTVGAIAAGGVAAYMHRDAIMRGVQNVRHLNRESLNEGYRNTMDTLGQGLAYVNRGNVGRSFAYLSDHFVFVGALLRQKELARRLDRMGALKGVGLHNFYVSLGENGYWSGGYFVPERTFCAVPEAEHSANNIFSRQVISEVDDEIQAHVNMFRPEKHKGYETMTAKAADIVQEWFLADEEVVDDERFRDAEPDEKEQDSTIEKVLSDTDGAAKEAEESARNEKADADDGVPDESPLDIAAAASLTQLPEAAADVEEDPNAAAPGDVNEKKRTYLRYLMGVAEQAGTGVKEWWPSKVPSVPMPSKVPSVPMPSLPSFGNVSMPKVSMLSKKPAAADEKEEKAPEKTDGVTEEKAQVANEKEGVESKE